MHHSPLRYPGGKTSLMQFLSIIVNKNGTIENYVEPFAGGAGAALGLLYGNHVNRIILNDADEFIYKFWLTILTNTKQIVDKIENTPVNVSQWKKQKELLLDEARRRKSSDLEIGFTAFYLNRCNRSGIITRTTGPIGGYDQKGKWKINARFNKEELIKRILRIAEYKDRISFYNKDAIQFLRDTLPYLNLDTEKTLIYLDPPYFVHGPELYRSYYKKDDHRELKDFLKDELKIRWVLSYDDVSYINELYDGARINGYLKNHFVNKAKVGKELLIFSDNCNYEF